MSLRSNGVMKVRRTASSTSRVMSSASCSWAIGGRSRAPVAALEQRPERVRAGDEGLGVAFEQVEEAVLLRHQRLEPAEHRALALLLRTCRSTRGHAVRFRPAARMQARASSSTADRQPSKLRNRSVERRRKSRPQPSEPRAWIPASPIPAPARCTSWRHWTASLACVASWGCSRVGDWGRRRLCAHGRPPGRDAAALRARPRQRARQPAQRPACAGWNQMVVATPWRRGCDEGSAAALGPSIARGVAVAGPARGGASRGSASVLGGDCAGSGK